MCNNYALTRGQTAIREAARAMRDLTGNLAPMPGIFPDYPAPIVRTGADGVRELALARWGMPSSPQVIFEAARRRADRMGQRRQRRFRRLAEGRAGQGADEHPQYGQRALGAVSWPRQALSGPLHQFQRVQSRGGRRHLVRPGGGPPARLLRRPLDAGLAGRAKDQHWLRDHRPVRLPDLQAQRRGGGRSPQGHAGRPDGAVGDRALDVGVLGGGAGLAAASG